LQGIYYVRPAYINWTPGSSLQSTVPPCHCYSSFFVLSYQLNYPVSTQPLYVLSLLSLSWHEVAQWLRHYATSLKFAGPRPEEVNVFFSIYLILPAALGPGVYSASNRNEYEKQKMFLGSRARPVRKVDNLTAICESIV
jgi:hypothetical protein